MPDIIDDNFHYGNQLSKYFSKTLSDYPIIIEFLDDDLIKAIYRIPTITKIMENYLQSKQVKELYDKDYSFLSRLSEMRKTIHKLLDDKRPIITPFGYNLNEIENFQILFELLRYHGINDAMKLFPYLIESYIPHLNFLNIYEVIKEKFESNNLLQNYEYLEKQFFSLLNDLNYQQKFEKMIMDYTAAYDNIMSFFIRPFGQKTNNLEFQKVVIKKVRKRLGKSYQKLFSNLDYNLRNALVHRNYYIDDTTNELVYNYYIKKNKNEEGRLTSKELHNKVYDLLRTSFSFFGALFIELFFWLNKNFDEFLRFIYLWNINYEQDILSIISEIFGIQIDTIFEFDKALKSEKELEAKMVEIRGTLLLIKEKYDTNEGEKEIEQIMIDFWKGYSKEYKANKNDHEIVFGYALYLLSMNKSKLIPSLIEGYKVFLDEVNSELKGDIFTELVISAFFHNQENINEFLASQSLTNILDKEIKGSIYDFAVNKKIISGEKILMLNELTEIQGFYQEIVQEFALIYSSESIKNYYKLTDLLKNINVVINVLEEQNKNLKGSQLTELIREIPEFENWPRPSFTKVIKCLEVIEKMGYIKIIKPKKGDIIITLLEKEKKKKKAN